MTGKNVSGGWKTVAAREISDLWWAGRMPLVVFIFSIAMSGFCFLLASNAELRLIPPLDSVNLMLQIAIVVGVLTGVVIGAGSIAGEREASTLESLLLAPVSRRQILVGKFLAALSPWPVVLAVVSPYVMILAPQPDAGLNAIVYAGALGTLLVVFGAGLGLLLSIRSSSSRSSLSLSLAIIVLTLIPTQLPGTAQTGTVGLFFKKLNPMESAAHLLEKLVVNNRSLEEMAVFLVSPVAAAAAIVLALFATPRLRLELDAGASTIFRKAAAAGGAVATALLLALCPPMAEAQADEEREAPALAIEIDMTYKIVKAGDLTAFETVVVNDSSETISAIVVAMNIVNLEDGSPVDPEDWSDERTQLIEEIKPGEEIGLDWEVNAILEGDYAIYIVALPVPESETQTSRPIATPAIHLTVEAHTEVNPGGVLPVVLGTPAALSLVWLGLIATRRRRVKA